MVNAVSSLEVRILWTGCTSVNLNPSQIPFRHDASRWEKVNLCLCCCSLQLSGSLSNSPPLMQLFNDSQAIPCFLESPSQPVDVFPIITSEGRPCESQQLLFSRTYMCRKQVRLFDRKGHCLRTTTIKTDAVTVMEAVTTAAATTEDHRRRRSKRSR